MNIFLRVDSSFSMGTGHVMRCMALADELRKNGSSIAFVCRKLEGNIISMIKDKGYTVDSLPSPPRTFPDTECDDKRLAHTSWLGVSWQLDAEETSATLTDCNVDWLIVDHYGLDHRWSSNLRERTKRIMIIDDLADRQHDCDLLLDQNPFSDKSSRYDGLVSGLCKQLLGTRYALLRPEFLEHRGRIVRRHDVVNRILISFGGSDPTNETIKAIQAVQSMHMPDISVDVVVGDNNQHKEQIKSRCNSSKQLAYRGTVDYMAELMSKADIAIGAGGATSWERCCLGLPSIIISLEANQIEVAQRIDDLNAGVYLGKSDDVTVEILMKSLKKVLSDPSILRSMSLAASPFVDGKGTSRVIREILTEG